MGDAGWIGTLIDGRYAVEAIIGQGGMGVVLRARHRFTGDTVAVKVLRPELGNVPELQQRFLAEARAPSTIGHAGIVKIVDAGRSPDGLLYLVMELLVGRPLRVAMQRQELGLADTRRVILELLDALVAAHGRGFVHRDLKPDNVFLSAPGGVVKLLDFGIAKVVDSALPRVRTATGSALGTPGYMSPEQIHEPSGVDARTDLWSVGVIVFEMLTGRLPFAGASIGELLAAITTRAPLPIKQFVPDASPQLEQFFATALARDPAHRFASAAAMKHALWQLPWGTAPGPAPSTDGANMTLATGVGRGSSPLVPTRDSQPLPGAPAHQPVVPPLTQHDGGYERPARSATPLVIAVIGVLGIAAIVLAIVVTRQPPSSAPADASVVAVVAPDAALADAMPVDAAIVIDAGRRFVPRDASAPADAAVSKRPLDARPARIASPELVYPDAPKPVAVKPRDCIADCAALHRCGVAAAKCVPDCQAAKAPSACATFALEDNCQAAAMCEMARTCGSRYATGDKGCKATLDCQLACKSDRACQCTCAAWLAPKLALTLARVDMCYWNCARDSAACGAECTRRYATVCNAQ